MKTLDEKMKSISAGRRKQIENRAAALIAEEMTLQELRRARKITQVRVAKALGFDRKASHGSKSEAICCFQRCERL